MEQTNETSPDALLDTFRGRGLKKILIFTVVIHIVVLIGGSVPFLWKKIAGEDTSGLSEEERTQVAVKEATASLRKIAEQHGIRPQDLSSQLSGGRPKAPAAAPEADKPGWPGGEEQPPAPGEGEGEEGEDGPKSAIEEEIEKVEDGPEVPPIPEEEEVDLFR